MLEPCEVKRDLLVAYLATLERLKVADWEHKQIVAAGTVNGAGLRSVQRIEAIKALRNAARDRYSYHCNVHYC